ncbi:phosphatidate cytidylyltransferase [Tenacibaculum adriaticum]|nr:phosphatidate cytidylyltransferase [Tenacibaculum adriaticum]
MENLLTRSISALIYAGLFLFAILFSKETYIGLITIFAGISLWEFSKIIGLKNIIPYILLLVLSIFAYKGNSTLEKTWTLFLLALSILSGIKLLINLFSEGFKKRNKFGSIIIQIEYVVLSFFFLMLLPFINNEYHPNIIIYIILIIWTNDSFAYLVGKNIGKNKLFERVSPKKTIEGFIGGLVFAIIVGGIIGKYSNEFSILNWVIIALIISVFGTLGDLIESKFKRQANVKDSGSIMPGHGGLLDRLDSLFFLAPFVYLYIHFLM